MLNVLLRARWAALCSSLLGGVRGKHKVRTILFGLLMVYVLVVFVAMSALLFGGLWSPLSQAGLSWLYYALAGLSVAAMNVLLGMFLAQSQLFEARDNELLLSMPIPPKNILMSRMLLLLGMGYVTELVILAPAAVMAWLSSPPSAQGVILYLLCLLLLPFLPLALSCLLGWGLAALSGRMRHKSLAVVVLSLLLMAGYFIVLGRFNTYLTLLLTQGAALAAGVRRALYPAYCFGMAIAQGDWGAFFAFAACSLVPFFLVYALLSRRFIKIVTTRRGIKKQRYQARELSVSSAVWAMVKKELTHLVSNPMYLLNGALGAVFLVAAGVLLAVYRDMPALLSAQIPGFDAGPYAVLILCVLVCTNIISAPSISLEAKTLWMLKSFPVDPGQVLFSKAYAHILVCLPAGLLASLSCCLFLVNGFWMRALVLLAPMVMSVLCGLWGVAANLWFPKFDWLNETAVIKQGISSMLGMFGPAAPLAGFALLYETGSQALGQEVYLGLCVLILALCCLGLFRYLATSGRRAFSRLQS